MNPYKLICQDDEIELSSLDIQKLDIVDHQKGYHILDDKRSFHIQEIHPSNNPKQVSVTINGSTYDFEIKDHYDLLVDRMGLADVGTKKITDIKSPMPGLILEISIPQGASFKEGDTLLILEAMKMENVIKAEADGVVKKILKNKSDAVEKGEIIIELEAE